MNINTWHQAIAQCEQKGCGYVLVTVLQSAGSTPRDTGTKMVVSGDSQFDTIGGGHLEYQAVSQAREMLIKGKHCQAVVSYPLSSKLGQCCGGAVKLLFEVMLGHQQHVAIFGAGHVAQALVPILAQLPLQIRWVDSRENFFVSDTIHNTIYDNNSQVVNNKNESFPTELANNARRLAAPLSNVQTIANDEPAQVIEALPESAWVIILTHNHQLDYELVETALKHPHLDYIGMIGSATKAKRFTTKLAHRGFSEQQIERLISPIGNLSIAGKRPIEVAVAISAQLINLLNTNTEHHVDAALKTPMKESPAVTKQAHKQHIGNAE